MTSRINNLDGMPFIESIVMATHKFSKKLLVAEKLPFQINPNITYVWSPSWNVVSSCIGLLMSRIFMVKCHDTLSCCYTRAWRRAGPQGSWTWKRWRQDTRHLPLLRRLCWARLEPEKPQAGATSSIVREKERKREKREKRETQASSILYVNIYREYYNAA